MRLKASYTVEASIIVPILLVCAAITMKMGIVLYQEIQSAHEDEVEANNWLVDDFYNFQNIGDAVHGK